MRGELQLYPGSTSLHLFENTLFLLEGQSGQLRAYRSQGGRYQLGLTISLPQEDPSTRYQLFQMGSSIRLIQSSPQESCIYEVLVPPPEEGSSEWSYVKLAGVMGVVALLVYFKMFRKEKAQRGSQEAPRVRSRYSQDIPSLKEKKG